MKNLIFTICLLIGSLGVKSQSLTYSFGDDIPNTSAIWFYDAQSNSVYCVRIYDTTYIKFYTDSIALKTVGFNENDITNFKQAYGWGDHDLAGYIKGDLGRDSISTTLGVYDYQVTHGLPYTPKSVHLQALSDDAAAACRVSAITATTFTITFVNTPVTAIKNAVFDWVAYK